MTPGHPMRLTWVQPEDLIVHEFAASRHEGREVADVEREWLAAGGSLTPPVGGASQPPADERLRTLARELLAECDRRPVPASLAAAEPDDLDGLESGWAAAGASAAPASAPSPAPAGPAVDRVHGAWLGRAAGCLLGKPVEKIPREGIREILESTGRWPLDDWFTAVGLPAAVAERWPWNRSSAATSLAENIAGMPEDDDLNYPMLALSVLETAGRGFGTDDVATAWLAGLPAAAVFTAERVAYRNLLAGWSPPDTATRQNPFREWIGAQIRTDVYGWVNPGRPVEAARAAWRDARLSHSRTGIYGALWVAAMCSAAVAADDVDAVLAAGASVVPPGSRFAAAVRLGADLGRSAEPAEDCVDRLYAAYGHLHWVHTLNNAALAAFALARGRGELGTSICLCVAGGWDTDSTGATVGSVCGALTGASRLDPRWVAPLRNRVASRLRSLDGTGFDGIGFDTLAARTVAVSSSAGR